MYRTVNDREKRNPQIDYIGDFLCVYGRSGMHAA